MSKQEQPQTNDYDLLSRKRADLLDKIAALTKPKSAPIRPRSAQAETTAQLKALRAELESVEDRLFDINWDAERMDGPTTEERFGATCHKTAMNSP